MHPYLQYLMKVFNEHKLPFTLVIVFKETSLDIVNDLTKVPYNMAFYLWLLDKTR